MQVKTTYPHRIRRFCCGLRPQFSWVALFAAKAQICIRRTTLDQSLPGKRAKRTDTLQYLMLSTHCINRPVLQLEICTPACYHDGAVACRICVRTRARYAPARRNPQSALVMPCTSIAAAERQVGRMVF